MDRECAKCGNEGPWLVYTVSAGADTAVVVLCDEHGAPIRELYDLGHTAPVERAKDAVKPNNRTHSVVPID